MIATILTPQQLADALGRSDQSITGYIRRGMPTDSVENARQWIAENIRNNGPPTIGERAAGVTTRKIDRKDLDEAEQRARIAKLEQEARAKQLKNDERDGLLVDQELAAQQVAEVMTILSARLETLPDWIRRECPAEWRERIAVGLEEQIYLAKKEAAARLRSVANGENPA